VNKLLGIVAAGAIALALSACAPPLDLQLDPDSRAFYQTARLVMTDEEEDIFRHLPDADSRREFMADFWVKRNPDPTSQNNEFKEEFERRIEYANRRFNEGRRGMDTDRGRIYIYLGPPEKTDFFATGAGGGGSGPELWWIYYSHDLAIQFLDERNTNSYQMVQVLGNLLQAITEAKLGAVIQDVGTAGRFIDFTALYDPVRRELALTIPAKKLSFKEEDGLIKAAFDFEFFLYKPAGAKMEKSTASKSYSGKPGELEKARAMTFTFPLELPPGKTYADIIVIGRDGMGKSRKIFTLKN
jgi:GWxTD domain-containing protein